MTVLSFGIRFFPNCFYMFISWHDLSQAAGVSVKTTRTMTLQNSLVTPILPMLPPLPLPLRFERQESQHGGFLWECQLSIIATVQLTSRWLLPSTVPLSPFTQCLSAPSFLCPRSHYKTSTLQIQLSVDRHCRHT